MWMEEELQELMDLVAYLNANNESLCQENSSCVARSHCNTFKQLHNTICYTWSSWCWCHSEWFVCYFVPRKWSCPKINLKGLSWVNWGKFLQGMWRQHASCHLPLFRFHFHLGTGVPSKPQIRQPVFIRLQSHCMLAHVWFCILVNISWMSPCHRDWWSSRALLVWHSYVVSSLTESYPLAPGCPNLFLEGHCPAEFSPDPN